MNKSFATRSHWINSCAVAALLTVVSGCASKPPVSAELASARDAFRRADANPAVKQYSREEWQAASAGLASADSAWREKKDKRVINQRAYLALQKIRVAEQLAQARSGADAVSQLELEYSRTLADVRSNEAAAARLEASRLSEQAQRLQREVAAREQRLQQQLAELEELKALQARHTDRGMVLTLGDVLFDIDKSTLKPTAIDNIDKVSAFMRKYPERSVIIEGHTDNTGDPEYNRELSVNRALAIRGALQARGVAPARIETDGLGEDSPVASNDSALGRQLNRRVEIIFENPEPSMSAAHAR